MYTRTKSYKDGIFPFENKTEIIIEFGSVYSYMMLSFLNQINF